MSEKTNEREKDPMKALSDLAAVIRPHIAQFSFIALMVVFCGGTVSTCKLTQAFMTWTDKNENGRQDWDTEKGEFLVSSAAKSTQFLLAFGLAKSISNFVVGVSSDKFGKKPVMLVGWVLGLHISVMVFLAPNWGVVVASNVFLGMQQGICWSLTIFMFIDYCGPSNRGAAVGLNESIGYVSVAVFNKIAEAMINEDSASEYNYRREPYIMIFIFCLIGLLGTELFLDDTKWLIDAETEANKKAHAVEQGDSSEKSDRVSIVWPSGRTKDLSVMRMAFVEASFLNPNLMCCCQAGLMINFITAFVWGILTKWLKDWGNEPNWAHFGKSDVADILLAYGLTKGFLQFFTGYLADRVGRKPLIIIGLWTAGLGMLVTYMVGEYVNGQENAKSWFIFSSFLLGLGTSLMYPNVIAAAAEHADPSWRASAVGTYRFWRDSGYWIGGLVLGAVADTSNIGTAVLFGCLLTFASGLSFLMFYTEMVEDKIDFAAISVQNREGNVDANTGGAVKTDKKIEMHAA